MAAPARRRATYEDVLDAPPHTVAEIIDGDLHLQPRPAKPRAGAASALGEELGPPDARVRAEPFEAFELDLSVLWADVQPA